MLGLQDPWIMFVYLLCIASTVLCVVWGMARWNREEKPDEDTPNETRKWAEEEDKVEQEL